MNSNWMNNLYGIIAAVISAIVGVFMYDRKKTDDRLSKLEAELDQHNIDLAVLKEAFGNLKQDTQEIKEAQRVMLDLLTMKRK